MADLADVETALASTIAAAIYPSGITGASAAGVPVRVLRGWPNAEGLDADLGAGVANVTVFPLSGMTRNVTRFPPVWQVASVGVATIAVALSVPATNATLSGAPGAGQVIGLVSLGVGYAYRVTATDTLATAAAALAALVPYASAAGAVITLSSGVFTQAACGADSTAQAEIGRQVDGFTISAWCPTPSARDAIGRLIRNTLDGLTDAAGNFHPWITLPDCAGKVRFIRQYAFDTSQQANLYRRDLIYEVEYPTILTATQPTVLFPNANIASDNDVRPTGPVPPISGVVVDAFGNILAVPAGILTT